MGRERFQANSMVNKAEFHEETNTTSWVDELYSRRLANKAMGYVGRHSGEDTPVTNLSKLRSSRIYLREEVVRGPGVKRSVRAYFLDISLSGQDKALSIVHCDYDPRNGRMRRKTSIIRDTHELGDVLRGLWLFSDVVGFE